jgi:hypothetical protein
MKAIIEAKRRLQRRTWTLWALTVPCLDHVCVFIYRNIYTDLFACLSRRLRDLENGHVSISTGSDRTWHHLVRMSSSVVVVVTFGS